MNLGKPHSIQRIRLVSVRLFLFLLCSFAGSMVAANNLTLSVDRDTVSLGDIFNLEVTYDISYGGRPPEPTADFDGAFEIVGGPSTQSSMTIINGRRSSSISWSWQIKATKTGQFTLPAFELNNQTSNTVSVTVEDAPAARSNVNDDIMIEYTATPKVAKVGEQITVAWKVMFRTPLRNANMHPASFPLSFENQLLEPHTGKDYVSTINGQPYQVKEFRQALYATQPGQFTLEPVILKGQYRPSQDRYSRFTPIDLRSEAIELTIEPVPGKQVRAQKKIPVTSQLRIATQWDVVDQPVDVGEPITVEVHMSAPGQLPSRLPDIKFRSDPSLKIYSDGDESRQDSNWTTGVTGYRTQKFAIIPQKAGVFTIPATKVSWWNTTTQKLETTEIPGQQIQVGLGAKPSDAQSFAVGSQADDDTGTVIDADQNNLNEQELEVAGEGPESVKKKEPNGIDSEIWWALLVIAAFIVFKLFMRMRSSGGLSNLFTQKSKTRQQKNSPSEQTDESSGIARQTSRKKVQLDMVPILNAHHMDLPPREACLKIVEHLRQWVGQETGQRPANITQLLQAIEPDDPWQALLQQCELFLYNPGTEDWPKESIREQLIKGLPALKQSVKKNKGQNGGLAPFTP